MRQTAIHEFSARIEKAGINPYVDIPAEVSRDFGKRGHIPVKGRLNKTPIRGTLVPAGEGRHRLYINLDMRKKSGTKVGDEVILRIELDTKPRVMAIPEPLRQALENDKAARQAFEKMTPSRQREILAYLNYLKTPEALERNVRKVIDILTRGEKDSH